VCSRGKIIILLPSLLLLFSKELVAKQNSLRGGIYDNKFDIIAKNKVIVDN